MALDGRAAPGTTRSPPRSSPRPGRVCGAARLGVSSGASFPLGHVHDVSNRRSEPAVSVHAYSPPLSTMSYYDVERGTLTRTRSELVEPGASPEGGEVLA